MLRDEIFETTMNGDNNYKEIILTSFSCMQLTDQSELSINRYVQYFLRFC